MIDGALVFDGHVDTPLRMVDEGLDFGSGDGSGHVDLPRLRAGGVDAVFMAAWVEPELAPDGGAERCERLLAAIHGAARDDPERAGVATTAAEVRAHAAAGRVALLAAIENGQALEGDPDNLDRFHARGVRLLTLTWMNSNEWGDAAGAEPLHGGLSVAGRELIDRMNELGVIVDLAHAAPSTFFDALERSVDPVVVSHAGSEARGAHSRNVTDDQARAVAESGGLVGIAFMPAYLVPGDPGGADLEVVADHVERLADVAGPAHVALGSDFDGVPGLPRGIDGVESLPALAATLSGRGWDDDDLAKFLGGNWLRVLERVVDRRGAART